MISKKICKILCPERYVFALALIFGLVVVVHYVLWYSYPPGGTVFTGAYNEAEAGILAGMRSAGNGFDNYWVLDTEPLPRHIFIDITNYGPIFTIILFLLLSGLAFGNLVAGYVLAKFLFGFFLVIAAYHLFSALAKSGEERKTAFLLFVFSIGLGAIFHAFNFAVLGTDIVPSSFFAFGVGAARTAGFIIALTIATSFSAIYAITKGRVNIAAVFTGLGFLFYPSHGIISLIVVALFLLLRSRVFDVVRVVAISVVFVLPWAVNYMLGSHFFLDTYLQINARNSVIFLPSVFFGFGLAGLLALYHFRTLLKTKRGLLFSLFALAGAFLTSLAFFRDVPVVDPVFASKFSTLSAFASGNYIILQLPLVAALILALIYVYAKRRTYSDLNLFLTLWLLVSLIITFSPREITRIFPDKMLHLLYPPVIVFAARGLMALSEKFRINWKKFLAAVIVVSLPAVALNFTQLQFQVRDNPDLSSIAFLGEDEYSAMKFLEAQPAGTLIAPHKIAINAPQLSNKKSLIVPPNSNTTIYKYEEKSADFATFYSDAAGAARQAIAEKYNLTYVFGYNDTFESSSIMVKIFESGDSKLYKII